MSDVILVHDIIELLHSKHVDSLSESVCQQKDDSLSSGRKCHDGICVIVDSDRMIHHRIGIYGYNIMEPSGDMTTEVDVFADKTLVFRFQGFSYKNYKVLYINQDEDWDRDIQLMAAAVRAGG